MLLKDLFVLKRPEQPSNKPQSISAPRKRHAKSAWNKPQSISPTEDNDEPMTQFDSGDDDSPSPSPSPTEDNNEHEADPSVVDDGGNDDRVAATYVPHYPSPPPTRIACQKIIMNSSIVEPCNKSKYLIMTEIQATDITPRSD